MRIEVSAVMQISSYSSYVLEQLPVWSLYVLTVPV